MSEPTQCPICNTGNVYWVALPADEYILGCSVCRASGCFSLTKRIPDFVAASRGTAVEHTRDGDTQEELVCKSATSR